VAERIEEFDLLVPVGANFNNAIAIQLPFTPGIVVGFNLEIPAGHHDLTGIQVWWADKQVIPLTPGKFATGNNRQIRYDTANFPAGQSWAAVCYNNDVIPHTFHLFVFIDEIGTGPTTAPDVILLPFLGSSLT
jgi:hypothetical protein